MRGLFFGIKGAGIKGALMRSYTPVPRRASVAVTDKA